MVHQKKPKLHFQSQFLTSNSKIKTVNNLLRLRKYIFRNLSAHIPVTVAVQIRDTQKDALHSSIVSVRKMSSVAKQ